MIMTHYMELLSMNQPWNLIIFMFAPMVLAETVLASEIFSLLYHGEISKTWQSIRHGVSIFLSLFFVVVTAYLLTMYVPNIHWRGAIDYIAVGAYILAVIPAILLLLQEMHVLGKSWQDKKKIFCHVMFLFLFVAFTHLAMVFGMADPQLAGYVPEQPAHGTHSMMQQPMDPNMDHSHMGHGDIGHNMP